MKKVYVIKFGGMLLGGKAVVIARNKPEAKREFKEYVEMDKQFCIDKHGIAYDNYDTNIESVEEISSTQTVVYFDNGDY